VPRGPHAFGFVTPNVVRRLNLNEMTSFYYLHIILCKRLGGRSQSLFRERQRNIIYYIWCFRKKSNRQRPIRVTLFIKYTLHDANSVYRKGD